MSKTRTAARSRLAAAGLLAWGQAGHYDAADDRAVIAALAGGGGGIVNAPTLTALAGLTVAIGPWLAIVDCGDRTLGVVGSREQQTVDVPAGGAQPRTDVLWCDVDPEGASWEINLYPESAVAGRAGIRAGTITVPAGANTAAAMTLAPAPASFGRPTPWAPFNPLQNSWTVGAGPPQGRARYRLYPATNTLEISALIRSPGSNVNVAVATFPAGFRPRQEHGFAVAAQSQAGGSPHMVFFPTGVLSARNIGTLSVVWWDVMIALDAEG